MACLTYQEEGQPAQILHHADAHERLKIWFRSGQNIFIGHNVAYDMAVLCERYPDLRKDIFRAYDESRVADTMIRQQLLDIASGKSRGKRREQYTLETLAKKCAGMQLQKDGWRLSYGEFIGVPLERWASKAREVQAAAVPRAAALQASLATAPKGDKKAIAKELEGLQLMIASAPEQCVKYPLDDARATFAVYQAQEKHSAFLEDQFRQTRAAFWLHLSSAWGIRTDEHGVEVLRRETQAELDEVQEELQLGGLVRANGVRDTKAAMRRMIETCRAQGVKVPRTDAHDPKKTNNLCPLGDACEQHVCLDAEACEDSEDPLLEKYALFSTLKKILSNDVEAVRKGVTYPLHTRYGLAATGRTTSSKPNIQNVSKRPGLREVYVPRPGMLFFECDYPTLELYTLAQCCVSWLGQSKLAEVLLSGKDPHLWVASIILKTTYEDVEARFAAGDKDVKRARQIAKPANFGFPGGLGADSFLAFTKGSMPKAKFLELGLTAEFVREELKPQWFKAYPEMPHYFARVNALCDNESGKAFVETLFTKRFRGDASYCAACNNGFQALGVDCAKEAGWRIAKAQYVEEDSPLFNTRTVAFVHDEFIGEVVDEPQAAHAAGYELARLMREGANKYLPDVPIPMSKMKPVLMRRWSKDAETVHDANGCLVPWQPKAA